MWEVLAPYILCPERLTRLDWRLDVRVGGDREIEIGTSRRSDPFVGGSHIFGMLPAVHMGG